MNKFLVKNPLITEKATFLSEIGKYMFLVNDEANKSEVKKAIEGIYKVHVTKVNIINTSEKRRRLGRTLGMRSGYKKAIVTLQAGQKLDIMPH